MVSMVIENLDTKKELAGKLRLPNWLLHRMETLFCNDNTWTSTYGYKLWSNRKRYPWGALKRFKCGWTWIFKHRCTEENKILPRNCSKQSNVGKLNISFILWEAVNIICCNFYCKGVGPRKRSSRCDIQCLWK